MKPFLQGLISRWFATMTPAHASMASLAEREIMRKRKLLSIILGISFFSTLVYLAMGFTLSSSQLLVCSVEAGIILCALWLNRQGYLKSASLIFFFTCE